MAHTHDVYDTGKCFEINEISRFIKETSSTKLVLVQGDHRSEVITFKMPRHIDGHDMMNCNKIRVHYINIDTKTNDASADVYEVTDLALCADDDNMLTFTWVVEAPATKYAGTLSFLIKFECTEGENILYQWNTAKYVGTNVLAGIDNSEEFVEKYSNVLNQWYYELTSGADSIDEKCERLIAEIEDAKENAKKAIADKAQEALLFLDEVEDIRIDYDGEVHETAGKAVREQIKKAMKSVRNDVLGELRPKVREITLLANSWVDEEEEYWFSQVVEIEGLTNKSNVNLKLTAKQHIALLNKNILFVAENENGVVTVSAIGQKPKNNYTLQVEVSEVDYE